MNPVNMGLFLGSAEKAMMVYAPEPMPAAPRPAMARPTMNMADEVATAQINEPTSKMPRKNMAGPGIMQEEERRTGAVSAGIYAEYAKAAHGYIVIPLLLASLVLLQGATVMSSYWLVWWQEK